MFNRNKDTSLNNRRISLNNAKLAVSGENVFIQKTSIDLSPSIDFHKKNSSRAGHLTVQYHGYLPLLLKSLITFLQYARSVLESSAFPLTLRGFAGCCGGYIAAGCWSCPRVHSQGWKVSSSLQKLGCRGSTKVLED